MLIVEDEAIIAMELENRLISLGYTIVKSVDNGEDAIKSAEADNLDLILMDIRINGELDGIETAKIIRERFGIPAVFSTAYLDEDRISRTQMATPFGYVLKPIQQRELKVALEMALYVARTDRKRTMEENVRKAQLRVLEASTKMGVEVLSQKIINEAEQLTNSKRGYLFFVERDQKKRSIRILSNVARIEREDINLTNQTFQLTELGDWADFIETGQPTVHQEAGKLKLPEGFPAGTTSLNRDLVVPLYRDGQLRAILGVCNKKDNYTSLDIEALDHFCGLAFETLERKKAEYRMRENEKKYRNLFAEMGHGFVLNEMIYDDTGRAVDYVALEVNPAYLSLLRANEEDIVGRTVRELISDPKEQEKWIGLFDRVFQEKSQIHYETESQEFNRIFRGIAYGVGGKRFAVVFEDITEQRQAEEALKESEVKHRILFETMISGVVYSNAKGEILDANPAAERIFGISCENLKGKTPLDNIWQPVHEDGSPFPGESHPSLVVIKTGIILENVVVGINHPVMKEIRWLNMTAFPKFREGEDTPYEAITFFRDITDLKT